MVGYDGGMDGGAARLWWLLRHYGHEEVAVLGGGIGAWLGPVRAGEEEVGAGRFEPRSREDDTVSAEELESRLGEPGLVVVDARAPERYRGDTEPIDPVAGHIPGAVNVPFAGAAELPRAVLDAEEIVVYCGSGVTACVDLLALARRPAARTRGSTRGRGATGRAAAFRWRLVRRASAALAATRPAEPCPGV